MVSDASAGSGGAPVNDAAVFIVGAPRSGTTLIQQMLDHHGAFAIPWESHFLPWLWAARSKFGDLNKSENRARMLRAMCEIVRGAFLEDLPGGEWIPGLEAAIAQVAEKAEPSFAGTVAAAYRFGAELRGRPRWGDKTPGNLNHLPLIHSQFPAAKVIHIVRDPRDVAASVMPLTFGANTAYMAAFKWVHTVRRGLEFATANPGVVLLLKYENLASEPERELRQVVDFLGEEFDPAMLAFHKDGAWRVPGQGMHTEISRPANTSRCGRWKKELSPRQVRIIEGVAGQLMGQFGYEPSLKGAKATWWDKQLAKLAEPVLNWRPNAKPLTLGQRMRLVAERRRLVKKYG